MELQLINTIYRKGLIMYYFDTRYQAIKAFPNAIIRKIKKIPYLTNAGQYVVFNDYTTYSEWLYLGYVR
jgi:hypothetical protein